MGGVERGEGGITELKVRRHMRSFLFLEDLFRDNLANIKIYLYIF